jgi:hypothetical protein
VVSAARLPPSGGALALRLRGGVVHEVAGNAFGFARRIDVRLKPRGRRGICRTAVYLLLVDRRIACGFCCTTSPQIAADRCRINAEEFRGRALARLNCREPLQRRNDVRALVVRLERRSARMRRFRFGSGVTLRPA